MKNSFEFSSKQEKSPFAENVNKLAIEVFREAAIARVDELVKDGNFPQQYADERIAAILRIEEGVKNPEHDGIKFAEIGMEQIKAFREAVDAAEIQTIEACGAAVSKIDEMLKQVKESKIVSINVSRLTQAVETTKQNIENSLVEFQTKIEEVRNLQAGLSSLINFDNFESSIEQLQSLLNLENKYGK